MRTTTLLLALGLLAMSRPALASGDYPGYVQSVLHLPTAPACTLCHATNLGGSGTVNTVFGQTLQGLGLVGRSTNSLHRALSKESMDPRDSDGDSVSDLEELRDGSNPNVKDREPPVTPASGGSANSSGGSSSMTTSGGAPSGDAGTSGQVETSGGGSGGAVVEVPEESFPELPNYPSLETGCAVGRSGGGSGPWVLALASAAGLIARRRRNGQ